MEYYIGTACKPPHAWRSDRLQVERPFRSVTNDTRLSITEHCEDPLPQTEMSAYNRILEISSVSLHHPLFPHLLYHLGEAAYCINLVRRSRIVLQLLCLIIYSIMLQPQQAWPTATKDGDRLPSLNSVLSIKSQGNRLWLQEVEAATSLQKLKESTPRHPPASVAEWVSGKFYIQPTPFLD